MKTLEPSSVTSPRGNSLLAALSPTDYDRILPYLRPVCLPLGEVLYESGDTIHTVYFPTSGLISQILTSPEGMEVEVGIIAREGLLGMRPIVSDGPTIDRAIVQIAGSAWRMPVEVLKEEFERSGTLRHQILRHMQAMITDIAVRAVQPSAQHRRAPVPLAADSQ